jgi:hypothetical protein
MGLPSLLLAKWPSLLPQMSELYMQLQDSKWERQPSLLVAKTASPSATEGIGILNMQAATEALAGRVSLLSDGQKAICSAENFSLPGQPCLLATS